ncbi:MAG TPA: alpha/beta fold hydrolase [Kofleriaceae bacterium]|nr:alpha/beta fold hydrolase [Kofleriaceae bacterium]
MKRWLVAISFVGACGSGSKPVMGPPPIDGAPADTRAARKTGNGPGLDVVFNSEDSAVELTGTYFHQGPESGDCYVFVHQLSSTRAEWRPVIDRLPQGAHVFAFDLRGHGDSTRGTDRTTLSWKTFETADWEKVEGDVGKAMALVNARRGAEPESPCFLAGSSIGSSAVLRFSGAHPERVTGLLLLSPGIAYRGVKTPDAARASTAPVMIVHSQEPGAADAAGALKGIWDDASPPVHVEVIADPGQEHGMKIVNGDPEILARVAAFLSDPREPHQ